MGGEGRGKWSGGEREEGGGGVELQSKFHQVTISNHIAIISLMILSSSDSTNEKVSVLRLSIPLKNLSFWWKLWVLHPNIKHQSKALNNACIITQYRSKVWSKGHHETKSCAWGEHVHFCLYSKIKEMKVKTRTFLPLEVFERRKKSTRIFTFSPLWPSLPSSPGPPWSPWTKR